uniref:peptidylprolyl isomerase n=1 Tax=Eptatretus burgeri TaxID=7764 RepID=A0A8C4N6X8_EPTBU
MNNFFHRSSRGGAICLLHSGSAGSVLVSGRERGAMGVEKETIKGGDGTLDNGTKFDSSRDRKKPFMFKIGKGEVIRGWEEAVHQMSVGERARLKCTPDYGYGETGYPGVIPANATLFFDVELLQLK